MARARSIHDRVGVAAVPALGADHLECIDLQPWVRVASALVDTHGRTSAGTSRNADTAHNWAPVRLKQSSRSGTPFLDILKTSIFAIQGPYEWRLIDRVARAERPRIARLTNEDQNSTAG